MQETLEIAREAELESMTAEGLFCHVLLNNINAEKELKRELLKTKEMTATNFTKIIDTYEAEAIQISESGNSKANFVPATGEAQKEKKEEAIRRCYRCNKVGHQKADCTTKVYCNNCKKESHSTAACSRNRPRSQSRGRWDPRDRAQTPGGRGRGRNRDKRTSSKELRDLKRSYQKASAKYVKEQEQNLNSDIIYSSGEDQYQDQYQDHEEEDTRSRKNRRIVVCRNTRAHLSEDTLRLIMETRKRRYMKGSRSFKMKFIPDTGASILVSSVSLAKIHELKLNREDGRQYSLTNASNDEMEILGMGTIYVKHP